jgi:hypothetical protein
MATIPLEDIQASPTYGLKVLNRKPVVHIPETEYLRNVRIYVDAQNRAQFFYESKHTGKERQMVIPVATMRELAPVYERSVLEALVAALKMKMD